MGVVDNAFLDAIEITVDEAIRNAGYDKTIQAQVVSCEDASIGKYKCKYQDSTIIAYSNDIETTYSKGSYVYILVPNNDLSKQKTILGTTKKLGTDYINQVQEEAIYETVGNNVITTDENYYLDTNNKDYVYKIYDVNNTSTSYILNIEAFEEYIRQVNYMYLSCNIKTSIAPNKQTNGHYGIRCKVVFRDNSTGENVIRTYVIDEDSMTGNPYRLVSGNKQFSYFEVDGSNFIRVDSIEIFNSGFPAATGTTTQTRLNDGDILISNLYLGAASALPEDAVNGISISFYTPKGSFFPREAISGDEISVTAQVRVKGKLVSSTDSISFYWGRVKSNIMTTSREYNKYLGRGWECLNDYNVSILEDGDQNEELIEWVSGSDTINIKLEDVPARDNEYKVAILYDSTIVTKEINIRNLMNGFELSIESSSGVNFYYDIGHPTLTCKIDNQDVVTGYVFKWAYENNMGIVQELPVTTELNNDYDTAVNNYQTLVNNINAGIRFKNESEQELIQLEETVDSFKQKQRVKDNKIYDVQVKEITTFGIFRCSVYKLQNDVETFIGTASITLFNTLSGDGRYSLIINNGTVAYQYDANGLSPNHATLEKPVEIQALSFTVYDNTGQELSEDILSHCKIRWAFPINNTMLEDVLEDNNATYDDEHNYKYYEKMTSMPYGIVNRYAVNKQRNQIKLTVTYKGMVLNAETQFTFTKDGNPGTNGTDFFVKLLPNTKMNKPPQFPQITKAGDKYILNYGLDNTDKETEISAGIPYQLFKIEIYHNGELAWTGLQKGEDSSLINDSSIKVNSIRWKVMKNVYGTDSVDFSNFVINDGDESTGLITLNNFSNVKRAAANILQCAIELKFTETRQTKLFYGVISIATATVVNDNFRVGIEDYTGFRTVLYASDGTNPQYDTSEPFAFSCLEKINGIQEDVSVIEGTHKITYEPVSYGTIQRLNENQEVVILNTNQLQVIEESSSERQQEGLKDNQYYCKPNNKYNGECVNNSLSCIFKQNNVQIGVINFPIYFLLNRYGLDNLNDWDGNKIEIKQDQGYILAPQMGAGKKEDDNSFTGVLMGTVKEADKYEQHGLFGYGKGQRTFFLNADNGDAYFKGDIVANSLTLGDNYQIDENIITKDTLDGQLGDYIKVSSEDVRIGNKDYIKVNVPRANQSNNYFLVDKSGAIVADNAVISGTVYASAGEFSGKITAGSGSIGGFDINSTSIHTQNIDVTSSATNSVALSSADFTRTINNIQRSGLRFAIGSKFGVKNDGTLYASNANISGNITADTLNLGTGVKIGVGNVDGLSAVATSGSYLDLEDAPPEFITEINNSGIKVHARSNINSNYTQIDANGMSIYKDGIKRASLGDTIILGRDGYSQLSLDSSSLSFLNMVYGGNIVFSQTDSGNTFVCSYDYSEGSIPLWGAETEGTPWRTKLYLYNPYVSGSMAVSEYLDANNIRVQGVQSVSYSSSGNGVLYFGGNQSQISSTTLRGQSIDIYAHNSTSGITIGRSGQNVEIKGNVTINGSAPSSGVTMSQVENKIESYGFLTSSSLTDYAKKSDYVPKTGGTFTGTIYTNGIRVSPASGYDEYGDPSTLTNYIKAVIKKHVKADSLKNL